MTDGLPDVNVPSIVESLLIFIFLCERVSLYNSDSIYYNVIWVNRGFGVMGMPNNFYLN